MLTPFWRGQGESVGSIETVLTTNLNDECKITSGNEDPNYWVNILAIEPTLTSIGTLGVNAGVQPKMQAGQVSINFADHLKSNDPVVLLGPPKH